MIIINLREFYEFNAKNARDLLNVECEEFFWKNINLLLSVKDLCEKSKTTRMECAYLRHAIFILSSDFINLAVATYKLLNNAFEKECYLIMRKGYETTWLLNTFIDKPNSVVKWLATDNFNVSDTYPVDIKKDFQLYQYLSKFVHPNSQVHGTYLGLMFVEEYTYQIFIDLIVCICNMIECLFTALEVLNNIRTKNYISKKDWFSNTEIMLHLVLNEYQDNLNVLNDFVESKLT